MHLQIQTPNSWRYVAGINSIKVEGRSREILTTRSKELALPESMAWDSFHEMSERFPSREFRVAKSLRRAKTV